MYMLVKLLRSRKKWGAKTNQLGCDYDLRCKCKIVIVACL
jgi:hypothetical protein